MQRNFLPDWFTHPTKRRARRVNRRVRAFYLSRALTRQRLALWGGALLVGLAGVVLTWGSKLASVGTQAAYALSPWWMLVWTPLMFMLSLLIVQVCAPGAAGGGIAQTIATLERRGAFLRERFLTFRVAVVKVLATLTGISAGGTFGYEGPIIQIGAALTHSLGRRLGIHSENAIRTTILAGGAASVAAAFNTPLAGIVFAIEEMGLHPEHSLYLGSLSKVLSPGLRLGYIVAPDAVYPKLLQAKQASDLHSPSLNQRLAAEVLTKPGFLPAHLARIRELYRTQCHAMLDALRRHMPEDVTWNTPTGGMFLWMRLPVGMDSVKLLPQAIQKGVAYVPGSAFYDTNPDMRTLRLSFVTATAEEIDRGIQLLAQAIDAARAG